MDMNVWVLGTIIYLGTVMPFIYWIGGCIRKHNNCDMATGEPLD